MHRRFQDVAIQCWEHRGQRLGSAPPLVCLLGDAPAAARLLEALDALAAQQPPARLSVGLRAADRPLNCTRIRLSLAPADERLQQMSLTRVGNVAAFEFTPAGLPTFRHAVETWSQGSEDFCACPLRRGRSKFGLGPADLASGEVWFWRTMSP